MESEPNETPPADLRPADVPPDADAPGEDADRLAPPPVTEGAGRPAGPVPFADPAPPQISARGIAIGFGAAGLIAVLALQVFVLMSFSRNTARVDDLNEAIAEMRTSLGGTVGDLGAKIDEVGARIDDIEAAQSASPGSASAAPAPAAAPPAVAEGSLPFFDDPNNDAAIGMTLGEVSGPSYYDGTEATYAPTDGTARVWMVWAHWCPFCQQELPALSDWWAANKDTLEYTELVTVTTSIDENRDNPLYPYLDTNQFTFPVIVDADLSVARKMGTTAFPYWVFTDSQGAVVGRTTGLLDIANVESIFAQMEQIGANTR